MRVYTSQYTAINTTGPQDLFTITCPSDSVVVVLSARWGQHSDEGDAESEMLVIQISRYSATGSGGTTPTPRPHDLGDNLFGGTVELHNSTQGVTIGVIYSDIVNIQAGWRYVPVPEERIYITPNEILAFELPIGPVDAINTDGSITFAEIGG